MRFGFWIGMIFRSIPVHWVEFDWLCCIYEGRPYDDYFNFICSCGVHYVDSVVSFHLVAKSTSWMAGFQQNAHFSQSIFSTEGSSFCESKLLGRCCLLLIYQNSELKFYPDQSCITIRLRSTMRCDYFNHACPVFT